MGAIPVTEDTATDELGHQTVTQFDAGERPIKISRKLGSTWLSEALRYDLLGRLTASINNRYLGLEAAGLKRRSEERAPTMEPGRTSSPCASRSCCRSCWLH